MKYRQLIVLMTSASFILTAGLIGCATTQKTAEKAAVQVEANWRFHDIVDAAFVKENVQIPMPANVMIIDSRPKQVKYDRGHIPMAVSIPDSQFEQLAGQLPQDKNALLIFYCGGLECKLSHKSAAKAEALGYKNVKVFAAGFPGWMQVKDNYAEVSVEWVKKQLDDKTDMILVDARPRKPKFDRGHIPGAISIPDTQFDQFKDQLPDDKNKLVVFYCGGFQCKLSHKSAQKAMDLGYTNVRVFSAGYPAWVAFAGKDAVAKAAAPAALKAGQEEGSIDHDTFRKLVAENPESIYLVDVRDADEYARGSLKTAVNIPVDQLAAKVNTLPSDKPIVFICGTGARSGESYFMVQDLRPELKDVYYVEAEMKFNTDGSYTLSEIKY